MFCKYVYRTLWAALDALRASALAHPSTATKGDDEEDVKRSPGLTKFAAFDKVVDTMPLRAALESTLNVVEEQAHVVYIRHVWNNTVAEAFLGDALFGADRTESMRTRVDAAVRRIQNLSKNEQAAVGKPTKGFGAQKQGGGGRHGGRGRQQQYQQRRNDNNLPPGFERPAGGRGAGQILRGGVPFSCFRCGGQHMVKDCPLPMP